MNNMTYLLRQIHWGIVGLQLCLGTDLERNDWSTIVRMTHKIDFFLIVCDIQSNLDKECLIVRHFDELTQ